MSIETKPSDAKQCWRTPRDLFDLLDDIFLFTIDSCASESDALLDRYWTVEDDAARQSWEGERVYCNPPFSGAGRFLAAATQAELAVVVWLLNAMTARDLRSNPPMSIWVPPRRIQFEPPCGLKAPGNTKGVCFLIYGELMPVQSKRLSRLPGMHFLTATENFEKTEARFSVEPSCTGLDAVRHRL